MSEHSSEKAKETVTSSTKRRGVLLTTITQGADKENGMLLILPVCCDGQFVLTFQLQVQPVRVQDMVIPKRGNGSSVSSVVSGCIIPVLEFCSRLLPKRTFIFFAVTVFSFL